MKKSDLQKTNNADQVVNYARQHATNLPTGEHHHHHGSSNVRRASHKGYDIVIRTTYEIEVNGNKLDIDVNVGNDGRVFYHFVPTIDHPSMVDLVKHIIDVFPDDFPEDHPPTELPHNHGMEK